MPAFDSSTRCFLSHAKYNTAPTHLQIKTPRSLFQTATPFDHRFRPTQSLTIIKYKGVEAGAWGNDRDLQHRFLTYELPGNFLRRTRANSEKRRI